MSDPFSIYIYRVSPEKKEPLKYTEIDKGEFTIELGFKNYTWILKAGGPDMLVL